MAPFRVDRISGFRLAAADPRAAADFLEQGLGFTVDDGSDAPRASAGLQLRLGATRLTVFRADAPAHAEPAPANAPAFHHLAIVVSDIAAAHARATASGAQPISRHGPVRLPASSGGVTAWKFRTPQGQALELLQAPTSAWRDDARTTGALFLGVDHTALGCAHLGDSLAFYRALGFHEGVPSHNHGPEQDELDGLDGVDLRIATLFSPSAGPHIELLNYRAPTDRDRGAADALSVVLAGSGEGRRVDAPDGHPLILV